MMFEGMSRSFQTLFEEKMGEFTPWSKIVNTHQCTFQMPTKHQTLFEKIIKEYRTYTVSIGQYRSALAVTAAAIGTTTC